MDTQPLSPWRARGLSGHTKSLSRERFGRLYAESYLRETETRPHQFPRLQTGGVLRSPALS